MSDTLDELNNSSSSFPTNIAKEQWNEEKKDKKEDRAWRKEYSEKFYWLFVDYLIVVAIIVLMNGCRDCRFELSDTIIVALLTTTTANLIGIIAIVTKYYFKKR